MLCDAKTLRLIDGAAADMAHAVRTLSRTLAGLGWSVAQEADHSRHRSVGRPHVLPGREVRDALYQNPIWQFELTFDGLDRHRRPIPELGANSLQSLMGLFLQCQGQFGTFLYTDPTDSAAANATTSRPATARRRPSRSRATSAASSSRSAG